MRAYAYGLTMAVASVGFSLALLPAVAYADEVPCMNEGDNASSITQTTGAEIPDENAGGEQDSSADALQAGNDVDSVEGKPIADAAEEPELPSSSSQPMSVGQQPQTSNLLGTTPELTSAPENEFDAQSDLADRIVDSDAAAGCIDNAPTSKGTLTAPKSQQPTQTGVGDENVAARQQMIVAIDYEPVPKGVTAALKARPNSEIGLSTFELYWQYRSGEGGGWVDILDASGDRLMAQTLRVPTSDETIGRIYRACMRADDPATGERVEVHSGSVTIIEGYGFTVQIEYDPPVSGCVAIFVAKVFGLSEAERADMWYEWQMSTDDGEIWTTISGSGTNADEHKAQLYVPTVKRSDSSSDDQIPVLTLIRVIAHASGDRTSESDPVMLTTQGDELDEDQADDPILLTTPSDECSEEAPIEPQDPDHIESRDPDHEEAMDDTGESQPALEAHAGVSAIYGAPSAPDRNVSSTLPPTGDAIPFAIPTALAAIAALAACVSLIVRRRIDALA